MRSAETRPGARRKWILLTLRVAGSALGLAYVFIVADPGALLAVALSIPAHIPLLVFGVMMMNVAVGAFRWRVVLWAYGATNRPGLLRLTHLYLVAIFYNSFLPGGVGGDVIRGIVSRESFGESGITRSLTVVFVERLLGLSGLLIVAGAVLLAHPLPGLAAGPLWGGLGLVGAFLAVVAIALGRRIAPAAPRLVGRFLEKLPTLDEPVGLAGGLGLSLVTQAMTAVAGFIVLVFVEPSVTLLDALVIVPVAAAAAFFPLTVGGAGAREAAFVFLCSVALDMAAEDAAAVSLVLFAMQLALGLVGGLLQLLFPLDRSEKT